jgi:hypothetical protein
MPSGPSLPLVRHLYHIVILKHRYLTAVCNASCAIPMHTLAHKAWGDINCARQKGKKAGEIAYSLLVSLFPVFRSIGLSFPIADDRVFLAAFCLWLAVVSSLISVSLIIARNFYFPQINDSRNLLSAIKQK